MIKNRKCHSKHQNEQLMGIMVHWKLLYKTPARIDPTQHCLIDICLKDLLLKHPLLKHLPTPLDHHNHPLTYNNQNHPLNHRLTQQFKYLLKRQENQKNKKSLMVTG